ncbi:CsbD family protein [Blastopirellula sp. JC732]|uniref:CsbD family protein n=1 Tax=Blastopirellula sediminis TaxID=2894196 RepID=A0A9X1MRD4_9BACT|nr:CsbD family protein [Blastopirellula sediminis]MCC9605695.1 CsbD family protein [Blastopirellula sediminis]MCC9631005.1 CsbD family protein [Blastopirellula sediminis]
MNRRRLHGKWKQWKGTLREAIGRLTGSRKRQFQGKGERWSGKAEETLGRAEEKVQRWLGRK